MCLIQEICNFSRAGSDYINKTMKWNIEKICVSFLEALRETGVCNVLWEIYCQISRLNINTIKQDSSPWDKCGIWLSIFQSFPVNTVEKGMHFYFPSTFVPQADTGIDDQEAIYQIPALWGYHWFRYPVDAPAKCWILSSDCGVNVRNHNTWLPSNYLTTLLKKLFAGNLHVQNFMVLEPDGLSRSCFADSAKRFRAKWTVG